MSLVMSSRATPATVRVQLMLPSIEMEKWGTLRFLSIVGFWVCASSVVCTKIPGQINSAAQGQAKPSVTSQTPPKAQPIADTRVPLIDHALSLADFPNMQPRSELKEKLGHLTQFIQNQPVDGAPATENTEVYLGRTQTALYIVFLCFDRHPALIRTHLARRENLTKDDYVTVNLDPFQDRQRSVEYQVNPSGVQADAAWTEANGADYSYDQVWDSDGRITPNGWMALISIPFRSLRFPTHGSDWGVVFWRNLPRNSENDFGRGFLQTLVEN